MSIDGTVDNYDLPNTTPLGVESIDISNISIGEKSPINFGLFFYFPEITLLERNGDTATISINGRISRVFWDSNTNQPRYFSIENNGKKTIFIAGPSNTDGYLKLIGKDAETYRVKNIENPLVVVNNSVYIIYSEVDLINEDEKGYLALELKRERRIKLYGTRNECIVEGMSPKMNFIEIPEESRLLGDGYYVMNNHLFDIVGKKEVKELPFCGNPIKGIYHTKGNSFYGRYENRDIKFCFYPLESIQIPNIDLFGRTFFTDKEGFILEGVLEGYKIEDPKGYKIDDDFIFIGLTDKNGKTQYIKLDVLIKGLPNKNFNIRNNLYTFKQIESKQFNLGLDEDNERFNSIPFACRNDYPILEERVYCNGEYNTGFSGENGVDYAFVLTKNGDKKLLAIRGGKVIEINSENRFEKKSSHSENLKSGVRVVGLHSNVGLVILTNNQDTTSNYRYYVLKEDGTLIYIGGKDNIGGNISKGEIEFIPYKPGENKNSISKIIFGSNGFPLVEFRENKTFIVCENDGKKVIYVLNVVNNYRQLASETTITIPEEEKDVEQYFKDFIENKVQLIPGTEYLYTPGTKFYIENRDLRVQFIGLNGEHSKAEKIEDLPKVEIGGKSYYILCNNNGFYSKKYFLYKTDGKQIFEIESLSSIHIRTSSCSSISKKYTDTTGLKKTNCGNYIYPKANDLLPGNIHLALVDDNGATKNQYVVYDEESNTIIGKIPTSQAPVKTNNPNEFIIISDDFDKYHTYDIQTGEIREKLIPEGLKLNSSDLTESYLIGWTGIEILMNDGKTKIVKVDGKDYYETKERGEFFGKQIVHLYDSKKQAILPFYVYNGVLSPVFEDTAGNMESILIKNGVLEYRFSYQSSGTKIPLNKIISTGGGEYIQFVNSNRVNEEKDKIVSIGNNSLRIGRSLNDYFSDIDSNYKAFLVEENKDGLKINELHQIEVKTCSLEYTTLLINGIEINLNFDYMYNENPDNSQNLGILENYLKKILGSLVKRYPVTPCGEVVDFMSETVNGLIE
ncbi:MAG: hypothetical protein PHI37_04265 [Candidatus Gracilibacteria bacterium]|nr:hypothetical protein [Candidatus Gracilibacteria bacterium]